MCGHSLMHRMSEKEQGGIGFQCGKRGEKKKRERDRVEGEERVFQKKRESRSRRIWLLCFRPCISQAVPTRASLPVVFYGKV